jgi:hypothetical protein
MHHRFQQLADTAQDALLFSRECHELSILFAYFTIKQHGSPQQRDGGIEAIHSSFLRTAICGLLLPQSLKLVSEATFHLAWEEEIASRRRITLYKPSIQAFAPSWYCSTPNQPAMHLRATWCVGGVGAAQANSTNDALDLPLFCLYRCLTNSPGIAGTNKVPVSFSENRSYQTVRCAVSVPGKYFNFFGEASMLHWTRILLICCSLAFAGLVHATALAGEFSTDLDSDRYDCTLTLTAAKTATRHI